MEHEHCPGWSRQLCLGRIFLLGCPRRTIRRRWWVSLQLNNRVIRIDSVFGAERIERRRRPCVCRAALNVQIVFSVSVTVAHSALDALTWPHDDLNVAIQTLHKRAERTEGPITWAAQIARKPSRISSDIFCEANLIPALLFSFTPKFLNRVICDVANTSESEVFKITAFKDVKVVRFGSHRSSPSHTRGLSHAGKWAHLGKVFRTSNDSPPLPPSSQDHPCLRDSPWCGNDRG